MTLAFLTICYVMVMVGLLSRANVDDKALNIKRSPWRVAASAAVWPILAGWQLGRMLSEPTSFEMNEASTKAMEAAEASLRERSRDANQKLN